MSISINKVNSFGSLESDRQRNRAANFVNKDDADVSRMAHRIVRMNNYSSNKKLAKNIDRAFNSLPIVAVASGLVMKKGIKPSLKNGAEWGLAVTTPKVIDALFNKKTTDGKKHSLSFGAEVGLSLGTFIGASALLDKAAKNPKVNKIVDTVIKDTKSTYKKISKEIKLPENLSKSVSELNNKVQLSKVIKTGLDKIANVNVVKKVVRAGKNVSRDAVKHAPMLVAFGIVGAVIGSAVKQGIQISNAKSAIKNNQLDTARELVDVYKQENDELKSKLAQAE